MVFCSLLLLLSSLQKPVGLHWFLVAEVHWIQSLLVLSHSLSQDGGVCGSSPYFCSPLCCCPINRILVGDGKISQLVSCCTRSVGKWHHFPFLPLSVCVILVAKRPISKVSDSLPNYIKMWCKGHYHIQIKFTAVVCCILLEERDKYIQVIICSSCFNTWIVCSFCSSYCTLTLLVLLWFPAGVLETITLLQKCW